MTTRGAAPPSASASPPRLAHAIDRRRFLAAALGALAGACATTGDPVDGTGLVPTLLTPSNGRLGPPYLDQLTSSFDDHIRRPQFGLGGIDYRPVAVNDATLVCPVAAGVLIRANDADYSGGMTLTIGHGLGWKTVYAHLEARFVGYRERVARRDVMAVMGASGAGATRGGLGVARHLHVTLLGPAWSPLYRGFRRQDHPHAPPGLRFALDPEDLSLAGRREALPYSRAEDETHDVAFARLHDEAVRVTDALLDSLADPDAARIKQRGWVEAGAAFDGDVDQRIWFVWGRLARGPHPFSASDAERHRATLHRFMSATPAFTAPIVEPARRSEYRVLRGQPMKTYDARSL